LWAGAVNELTGIESDRTWVFVCSLDGLSTSWAPGFVCRAFRPHTHSVSWPLGSFPQQFGLGPALVSSDTPTNDNETNPCTWTERTTGRMDAWML